MTVKVAMVIAGIVGAGMAMAESRISGIPLPEHPRPDFERAEWLNLNGEWDFGFAAGKYDRKILVPFGWGSPLSGVKMEDKKDVGYYRRNVKVPEAWQGKRVFVVVGAADHDTCCIFDGNRLGKHVGGYTPFEYELTEFVDWGKEQPLEFEVWDPPNGNNHHLYGKQGYGNARGIWQTVYLEARAKDYIESVAFRPSLKDRAVTATVAFGAPVTTTGFCRVAFAGKTFDIPFRPGRMSVSEVLPLENPHLWTLDDPYLYDVTLTYGKDSVKTYFGFREVGTGRNPNGDNYVTLNGKPIYLQLCLDQSYHPEGWYTFPSDEFMKNDILLSKKLALTGNRVHIKVEIPRKLYWADRLGLLIQADVPCAWGDACEAMFEEHWKCFEGMLKRDFNHPCIYQWTLFNETWGLKTGSSLKLGLAEGKIKAKYCDWTQRRVAEAYFKAKAADPTRLIEDNSPCLKDHVVTDVNSWHAYTAGYNWEHRLSKECRDTYPGSRWNYAGDFVQGGEPMMNSECGNVWGYVGSTGDCDFTWDYHMMMNAFRRHLKCAGWLYTEHHDVCNEWNGYVRFDRSRKYDGLDELAGMTIADFHRDAAIFFAGTPHRETGELLSPGQRLSVPVGVSFTTDRHAGRKLQLVTALKYWDEDGNAVVGEERVIEGSPTAKSWQCEKLWDVAFEAPQTVACGCLVTMLQADGEEIARNFWSFGVTNVSSAIVVADKSEWSGGSTNVLGGLKLNGFGKGFFEFELPSPAQGGIFHAELSAKRKNGKDYPAGERKSDLDYMLGGGDYDRSKNPNSYPQTSETKFPSNLKVVIGGKFAKEIVLADDPADHRGILSWLSQPVYDWKLHEAGSYGYSISVPVPASAVKDGKVTVRLEADNGLAVYGPKFGRYPMGPHIEAIK